MIRTFRLSEKDAGKTFTIRFIPNINDVCNNIITIKNTEQKYNNRYICFAVVNGVFKLFNFGPGIYKNIDNKMFMLDSDMAIKVRVGSTMNDNVYEVIKDDVFTFSNIKEKNELVEVFDDNILNLSDFIKREEKRKPLN